MRKKVIIRGLFIFSISLILNTNAIAQVEKLQSAYLYNISRYMEWPAGFNENEFIIGVMGKTAEILPQLEVVANNKKVVGKPIIVKSFESPEEIFDCNILFIPERQSNLITKAVEKTQDSPTLVVTEKEGMLKKGADVNFVFNQNKLQFEIDLASIQTKSLKVNSRLQNLAMN